MTALPAGVGEGNVPVAGAPGRWTEVWRRFRQNRIALLGLITVILLSGAALAAPALTNLGVLADPYALDAFRANTGPGAGHPLGTDALGRDLLSRALHGARISLSIGVLLQLVVLAIGGPLGVVSGYVGGTVDKVLMRLTDVMFAFPDLLFVLVVASVFGPGYWNIVLAVGLVRWAFLARLVRGEVLSVKSQEFITAARGLGASPSRIIGRHVVPNILGPVIVTVTFGIPVAIFTEAFLSFVGVGLRAPTPSWGVMISDGYQAIFAHPHEVMVPAVAISLTTLAFNFIGDGLRDALDPRSRR